MSTKSKSYAEQISNAQVMAAGLKSNLGKLQKRGMNEEFIASLESSLGSTIAQNNEQEKLKADLKAATANLDGLMLQLSQMMQEAVKVVKLEMPQAQWKEFGIQAKK